MKKSNPGDGQVWAGGSPNFDERTGTYKIPKTPNKPEMSTPATGGLKRVSPGVYRDAAGKLVRGRGGNAQPPKGVHFLPGPNWPEKNWGDVSKPVDSRLQIDPKDLGRLSDVIGGLFGGGGQSRWGRIRDNALAKKAGEAAGADPNRYEKLPDGSTVGTLIGWDPDRSGMDIEKILQQWASRRG